MALVGKGCRSGERFDDVPLGVHLVQPRQLNGFVDRDSGWVVPLVSAVI